jgi:hypothetical protein
VNQANDGERNLSVAADSEQPSKGSIDDSKLTLLAEEPVLERKLSKPVVCASASKRTRERSPSMKIF